jgi:hypothetical protein
LFFVTLYNFVLSICFELLQEKINCIGKGRAKQGKTRQSWVKGKY